MVAKLFVKCTLAIWFCVVSLVMQSLPAEEAGPNAEEVCCFLQLNHLRLDPEWETARLLFAAEGGMSSAAPNLDYEKCRTELRQLEAVPALVFDVHLMASARAHAQYMIQHDRQTHEEQPGDAGFTGHNSSARIQAAGYPGMAMGENVFLRAVSPWNSLRGFIIDWGPDADGMQSPRGHRLACMSKRNREVGIAVIRYENDLFMSTCHNFGYHRLQARFVGGVVYQDRNGNARYDAGEACAGYLVAADSGEQCTTGTHGLFSLGLEHQEAVQISISAGAESAVWQFPAGPENIFLETQAPRAVDVDRLDKHLRETDLSDASAALALWWETRQQFMTQAQRQQLLDTSQSARQALRQAQLSCMDLFRLADVKAFEKRLAVLEQPYKKHAVYSWFKEARQLFPLYQDAKSLVDDLRSGKRVGPNQVSKQVKKSLRLLAKLKESVFYDALESQILVLKRALARK